MGLVAELEIHLEVAVRADVEQIAAGALEPEQHREERRQRAGTCNLPSEVIEGRTEDMLDGDDHGRSA